jgi:hypothetical protein
VIKRSKYVIINDIDQPCPNMVCQWVPHIGYCYLNRGHARFDGMRGHESTDVREFGFSWAENRDGTVSFYRNELEPTATYRDGEPRPWQSRMQSFEWRVLSKGVVVRSRDPVALAEDGR